LGVSVPIWEVRENNSAASSCAQPVGSYQQHNERTGAGATQSKTPKRGSWSGLVWFRKSKRNNKPNHKQFIIHESINTHSTEQDELPAAKQRKVADTN